MMNLPSIETLKELIERQRPNLDRGGLKKEHYDMLEAVLQNWISGGPKTSAVVFKSDRWNKYETISFLEGLNFFRVQDGKH